MSYKLRPGEPFDEALPRLVAAQVELAGRCLAPDKDVHKGAHEARKAMKRLRALLALFRGAIPEADYQALNVSFRDIARALAGTREIQAMLDSLDLLDQHPPGGRPQSVLKKLRTRLEAKRDEASAAPGADVALRAELQHRLSKAAQSATQLSVARSDFGAIEPGLVRGYRLARRAQETAYRDDTAESFHEWRKALQRHWRHMQLLTLAWPDVLRARAQATRAITEAVGWDHDLAMLDQYLATQGRGLGTAAQVRGSRQLCAQRQDVLRRQVAKPGLLLFAENAGAFTERLERYWRIACDAGRETAPESALKLVEEA